jgi:hypothetical protein
MFFLLLFALDLVAAQCTSPLRAGCQAQRCCGAENVTCQFVPDPTCTPRCAKRSLELRELIGEFDEIALLDSHAPMPIDTPAHIHVALAAARDERKRQPGECFCRAGPVACSLGQWGGWSGCTLPCGSGTQSRSRTYTPATCGGACADPRGSESQSCNTQCCPQDCTIGAWSAWSACAPACGGGGSQSRSRSINAAQCGGACGTSVTMETQPCDNGCCAVACQLSAWTLWGGCSATCGGGSQSRSRTVQTAAACGGAPCAGPLTDQQSCGTACCPVDCVLTMWSSWSACSVTCGAGTQSRARTTQTAASCGGACSGGVSEMRDCLNAPCTPPGLPCADYRVCQDCTDRGKTSPRACVYCADAGGASGVCQSLHVTEGEPSSGQRACPSSLSSLRATSIGECPAAPTVAVDATAAPDATASATAASSVVVTVELASALGMAMHATEAMANATLPGGIRLQVHIGGEQGALVRSLGPAGGIGAYSPSRDGPNPALSNAGQLRSGLSMVLSTNRPVVLSRLVLTSWDASDAADLVLDSGSARTRVAKTLTIRDAESSFDSETASGVSEFVVVANGAMSEFSIKSFSFMPLAQSGDATESSTLNALPIGTTPDSAAMDTTTIAVIAACAAVCVLVTVVLVIVCVVRRKKKQSQQRPSQQSSTTANSGDVQLGEVQTVLVGNYGRMSLPSTGTIDTFATAASDLNKGSESGELYRNLDLSSAQVGLYRAPGGTGISQPYVSASEAGGLYQPLTMMSPTNTQEAYRPLNVSGAADDDETYVPVPPKSIV